MYTIAVPRSDVRADELVEVLRDGLGSGYNVLPGMRQTRAPFSEPVPGSPDTIVVGIGSNRVQRAQVTIVRGSGRSEIHISPGGLISDLVLNTLVIHARSTAFSPAPRRSKQPPRSEPNGHEPTSIIAKANDPAARDHRRHPAGMGPRLRCPAPADRADRRDRGRRVRRRAPADHRLRRKLAPAGTAPRRLSRPGRDGLPDLPGAAARQASSIRPLTRATSQGRTPPACVDTSPRRLRAAQSSLG